MYNYKIDENNDYYKTNPELYTEMINYINKSGSWWVKHIEDRQDIVAWINLSVEKLQNPIYNIRTKVYWIINNLNDFPKCKNPECNNKIGIGINIKSICKRSYKYCCCQKCASKLGPITFTETCRQKYGVNNVFQLESVKQKSKQTRKDKYGDENYRNMDKIRQTNLKKYGVEYFMQCEDGINKFKKSMNDKYGVDFPLQNEDILDKMRKTNLERRGVEWTMQDQSVIDKYENTCINKYGCRRPNQNPEIMKKVHAKYTYNLINFDSAPELAIYIFLQDNQSKFEYQPKISFVYEFNNKQHILFPDFKINEILYEIKGDQFISSDGSWQNPYDHSQDGLYEAKHQCLITNNIQILYEEDYKKYMDYCKDKFNDKKWYLKFRNNV